MFVRCCSTMYILYVRYILLLLFLMVMSVKKEEAVIYLLKMRNYATRLLF